MARRPPPQIEGMHSLKVDNISYNTTPADLRRLFDKYGEIGDIHIPRDKYSRTSKGFAFVRFYSRRDAEYARDKTDGKWMDGRELRVNVARYERVIDERGGGRYRSRSRSPRRRSRSRSPRYSRSRSPRRSRSRDRETRDRSRSPTPKSRTPSASPDKRSASPAKSRSGSPDNRSRSRSPDN